MLRIHTLKPEGYFGSNCYLISSDDEWAVIDPSISYHKALSEYPEIKERIRYILITHAHFDHILEIDSWITTGATVMVGARDANALSDPHLNCYLGFLGVRGGYQGPYSTVSEGDKIPLGKRTIEVIEAPGHTPGGVCYKCANDVFVGDMIFSGGGYGRCDLPGGDIDALEASLYKLFSKMLVGRFYPGHGNSDTFEKTIQYFK